MTDSSPDFDSTSNTDGIDAWSDTASIIPGPSLSHPPLDINILKTYYTTFIGLSNALGARQALPPELALYICQLAGFEQWGTKHAPEGYDIYAHDSEVQSITWFQFGPFTKRTRNLVKSVQLVTMSKHQGWVSDRGAGSWSWFELQLARPTNEDSDIDRAEVKLRANQDKASWRSHSHPVDRETAAQQGRFAEHRGTVFDSDHELWEEVKEGDVLQVVAKARFGGWANTASDGMLIIGTWWEPSVEMMDLLRNGHTNT